MTLKEFNKLKVGDEVWRAWGGWGAGRQVINTAHSLIAVIGYTLQTVTTCDGNKEYYRDVYRTEAAALKALCLMCKGEAEGNDRAAKAHHDEAKLLRGYAEIATAMLKGARFQK